MDGGAWWATDHGVAKSRTRLSNFTFTFKDWVKQQEKLLSNWFVQLVLVLRCPHPSLWCIKMTVLILTMLGIMTQVARYKLRAQYVLSVREACLISQTPPLPVSKYAEVGFLRARLALCFLMVPLLPITTLCSHGAHPDSPTWSSPRQAQPGSPGTQRSSRAAGSRVARSPVISPSSSRAWSLLALFHSLLSFSAFLGAFLLPPSASYSCSQFVRKWGKLGPWDIVG